MICKSSDVICNVIVFLIFLYLFLRIQREDTIIFYLSINLYRESRGSASLTLTCEFVSVHDRLTFERLERNMNRYSLIYYEKACEE